MRILIVSKTGDSADFAKQLLSEGHEVILYLKKKRLSYKLNIPFTKNPTSEMIKSDFIIIEDDTSGEFADKVRSLNRAIIGGGTTIDRLWKNQEFRKSIIEGCNLDLAKPTTKGIRLEIGGWFNGEEFLKPSFLCFPYFHLGTGNVGPLTRGMGAVGFYKIKSKFNEYLKKLETFFRSSTNYAGYIGLDCFVNNDSLQVIDLQAGLHFPMILNIGFLHNTLGTFLFKLALKNAKMVAVQPDRFCISVITYELDKPETFSSYYSLGGTIEEAKTKVYKTLQKDVPNASYYRIDIGDGITDSLDQLKKWEWF